MAAWAGLAGEAPASSHNRGRPCSACSSPCCSSRQTPLQGMTHKWWHRPTLTSSTWLWPSDWPTTQRKRRPGKC
eukprot:6883083-Prymnesium_polylepis.1